MSYDADGFSTTHQSTDGDAPPPGSEAEGGLGQTDQGGQGPDIRVRR